MLAITPTLDGILASFNKTITQLEKFTDKRNADIAKADALIEQNTAARTAALADVQKAATVRAKIKDLVAA